MSERDTRRFFATSGAAPLLRGGPLRQRGRVLVIDDDPLFRSLVAAVLRECYDVSVAVDGEEGFYKAMVELPELVVIDMRMPGWDGLQTVKAFRSHPAMSAVRLVILTGQATRQEIAIAMEQGADGYFLKGNFSREAFLQAVGELLACGDRARRDGAGQWDRAPAGAASLVGG